MNRQLRRRLEREAQKIQTPANPISQKMTVVFVDKYINDCPIFVGIPLRADIDREKLANHCVAGIKWMIERSQIPNVRDVYEMSIERLTHLEPN